jgi:hypothetical protein
MDRAGKHDRRRGTERGRKLAAGILRFIATAGYPASDAGHIIHEITQQYHKLLVSQSRRMIIKRDYLLNQTAQAVHTATRNSKIISKL